MYSDEEGRSPSRQDAQIKFYWEFSDWSDEEENPQETPPGILKATKCRDSNGNKPSKIVSFDWPITIIHPIPRNRRKKKSQGFLHLFKYHV